MMRILLAASLLVLSILPASAQGTKIDCSNAVTQVEMDRCASSQYKAVDADLNKVYKQVLGMVQTQAKDKLRQAQRAWVNYRDRHCQTVGAQAEGGSMQPLLITSCLTELAAARIAELEKLLPEK
jgi:uncharacterized protein YecT (DUF1311 family)